MDFQHILAAVGAPALVAALVAIVVANLKTKAPAEAAKLGNVVASTIEARTPANFRSIVTAELKSLAGQADFADATVTAAAAKILAKVAPSAPQATLQDVLTVIGDSTKAFVAGLAV
jgi:hypothetical protein